MVAGTIRPNIRQLRLPEDEALLAAVYSLWRAHSDTLGFFTSGAFREYSSQGQLLVATNDKNECYGYCLYRASQDVAILVHLCVADSAVGAGLARSLVDQLKIATQAMRGIRLSCRRDYSASALWPKLGFVAIGERPGRGRSGAPLTTWWFDHGHPTLFSEELKYGVGDQVRVAIDANIFFDLDDSNDAESFESQALLADWIADGVSLCLTPEIFNEIHRQENPVERNRQRKRAASFDILEVERSNYLRYETVLGEYFPRPRSLQDESDLRQLANALAANAEFFVTRDSKILGLSDSIYDHHGMVVLRPVDLLLELDLIRKEHQYRPVRLAGTQYRFRLVRSGESDRLIGLFQVSGLGESQANLRGKLLVLLADPDRYQVWVCETESGALIGCVAFDVSDSPCLRVELLRVVRGPLAPTLARHLAWRCILLARKRSQDSVLVGDRILPSHVVSALIDTGFVQSGEQWLKVGPNVAGSPEAVAGSVKSHDLRENACPAALAIVERLDRLVDLKDRVAAREIEAALWPAKILGTGMNSYVIPIRPAWAKDLFDEELAGQDLFGARAELALRHENVYYRSRQGLTPDAPARILWYVSMGRGYRGSGALRAVSYLDEVTIALPKTLFRTYRRLGIYTWKDLLDTARGDLMRNVMALRFSHTEILESPIPWAEMQATLRCAGIRTQLQSPIAIPETTFFDLYLRGMPSVGRL